jgi:hypothetical protein
VGVARGGRRRPGEHQRDERLEVGELVVVGDREREVELGEVVALVPHARAVAARSVAVVELPLDEVAAPLEGAAELLAPDDEGVPALRVDEG